MKAKLKLDFHTHTAEDPQDHIPYSARELIDKAHEQGYDALAITNHNALTFTRELERHAEQKDVLLVPGIEITVSRAHVLIINPDLNKNSDWGTLDDLQKLKNDDNLIIAPHPFFRLFKSLQSRLFSYHSYFDAIEFTSYYNSLINFNKKAVRAAGLYNRPLIGNSDCHHLWQFGKTYTLVEAKKDVRSIIEAVKEGKIELQTSPLSMRALIRMAFELLTIEKFWNLFKL